MGCFIMKLKTMWKKAGAVAAAVLMLGGAALAASPSDIYTEAVQEMAAHPDGEYTITVQVQVPLMGQADIVNTLDLRAEPMQSKSVIVVQGMGRETTPVTTYVEQDGKQLNVYYSKTENDKTTWHKTTQPLKNENIQEALQEKHNILAGVKSVTDAGNNAYDVVFDSSRMYNADDMKKLQEKYGYTKEQADVVETALQALQQAGDITATMTIDPQTKRISHVDVPMTPQLQKLALALLDKYETTETNKAVVRQIIQSSEVAVAIDAADLPENADLTVPEDVKKQAK